MLKKNSPTIIGFVTTLIFTIFLSTEMTIAQEKEENLKVTEQTLKNLKLEGIPDNIIESLQSLQNQEFANEKEFLHRLKKIIGDEQTDKYKSLILKNIVKEETISLEEIVVIGKLKDLWTDLPRAELPRSVESIDRKLIDNYGINTVQDAVKRLSGVMPTIEGVYPRRNEDLTIRGQQYSPIMINGFVMPHRGYLTVVTDNIERIDIYKGPGSVPISGANTDGGYGGFLNMTTKKPFAENSHSVNISAGGGSYDARIARLSGDFNQVINKDAGWFFRMNAEADISHPFYMPSDDGYSPDQNYFIAPTIKKQIGDNGSIILALEYQRLDKLAQYGVPLEKQEQLLPYDAFIGNENNVRMGNWMLSQLIGSWDIGPWLIRSGLSFMRLSEKMSYWYIHSRITDIHNVRLDEEASNRDWTTISAYFDTKTTLNTGPLKHFLLLRADFLRDSEDGWYARSLSDDKKTRPFIDLTNFNIIGIPGSDAFLKSTKDYAVLETNRDCLGFALQDEILIDQVLRISLGTRVDRHSYIPYNSKDWKDPRIMASPRAGITWNVFKKLAFYVAYSHMRTPNWGNVDIKGNEITNNRYSDNYEIGIKSQLTERLLASCNLFYNDQKNLPVTMTSGNIRYAVLEGRFLAKGVSSLLMEILIKTYLAHFLILDRSLKMQMVKNHLQRIYPKIALHSIQLMFIQVLIF